jgi:predicted phosphate transport protein (TIGR00153 family)
MKNIWDALGRFFGTSHNDEFAALMSQLAQTSVECAHHFRETRGSDLAGIIDYERKGDVITDKIHEILDNAFIMRFDISDAMRLVDELDNVLDGMRKIAVHIDIYKAILGDLKPDAIELLEVSERMQKQLKEIVGMLAEPRLSLPRVRDVASAIDDDESVADKIAAAAERRLVEEYRAPGANRLEFIAWEKLYRMLEEMTDHANHCAKLIVSIARKEA